MTDNWNAGDYAKNSSAQELWASELIDKLGLIGNEHLLDIGCGDGKITNFLAEKLNQGRVVGIDRSEDMISLASKKYCRSNLLFTRMDATAISLPERFDVAFSTAVLHWVQDHRPVLLGLRNHLVDKGKILLQMGGYGNAQQIAQIVEQTIRTAEWQEYFIDFQFPYNFCRKDDYQRWLAETGFKAQRIELIEKDMVHDGREGLLGWLRTTWFPYTDRLPEAKRMEFLNLVIDRYLQAHPVDADGRTHVKMVRLEVEACAE